MQKASLDPLIPTSLIDSIKSTFGIQASSPIEITEVKVVKSQPNPGIAIVSVIGIHSTTLEGSIALCFPQQAFLGIVNNMLGETYKEINSENSDAAGELLNILYAGARVKINKGGHDFSPAIPSILRGNELHVNHGSSATVIRIDCKSQYGFFHVEISLRKNIRQNAA